MKKKQQPKLDDDKLVLASMSAKFDGRAYAMCVCACVCCIFGMCLTFFSGGKIRVITLIMCV